MQLGDISCDFTYQQRVQAAWGNSKKNASKPWGLHRPLRKASLAPDAVPLAALENAAKSQPNLGPASETWAWDLRGGITEGSKGDHLLLSTPSILSKMSLLDLKLMPLALGGNRTRVSVHLPNALENDSISFLQTKI